jgi:glycosyltransferase involved in cell wall biosynthesis
MRATQFSPIADTLLLQEVLTMKIAQIAPLQERVPPKLYGGTERVVSYFTEELVRQGHEVTLFASGDSITRAELVPCCETALRLNPAAKDSLPYQVVQLEKVRQRAHQFDILHFHNDSLHFPLFRRIVNRTVTTLHGRLDLPDLTPFYTEFPEFPLVSISDAQRRPMPPVNWIATVPHGLPRDLLPFQAVAQGGYLAFLGRISPEKRPDRAIEIATRTGFPLKIAAKVDKADADYWSDVIKPMVDRNPSVEFVGEIGERQKAEFLGNALALLFPIDWPEPFGLVMIEAMSCGTPVVAFRCGSVPEVIESGVSGYIVNSIDEAIDAVRKIEHLDRGTVRRAFEQRFTVECMARRYLAIYDLLLSGKLCGNRMMRPPHRGRPFRLPSTLTRHSAGSLSPEREAARKVAQDAVTNSASVAAHSS